MTERPILFSAPMVRAILAGAKRQTRRVVKRNPPTVDEHGGVSWYPGGEGAHCHYSGVVGYPIDVPDGWAFSWCPYGAPGDRLWVRETWEDPADHCPRCQLSIPGAPCWCSNRSQVNYRATPEGGDDNRRWRPSIFMPRWASRITLAVESVRVERLQDIGEEDARAEGIDTSVVAPSPTGMCVKPKNYGSARDCFADLWREINGDESWDANPWVWVIGFSRVATKGGA